MEKVDIVRSFLYEIYSIDQRIEHFKRFQKATPEEQKSIMAHLNLHNLFLLRRLRDPGFYQFICSEVFKNKKTLRNLKGYIRKVIDREILPSEEDIFKLSADDETKESPLIDEELDHPPVNPFESVLDQMKNMTMVTENSLKYFTKRLEKAMEENDEIATMAIHSLIVETRTGMFVGNLISEPVSPYDGPMYVDRWDFHRERQMVETLNYSNVWERIKNSLFENPAMIMPNDLHDYILENILPELTDVIEGDKEGQLISYSKFINNAGSMAAVLWFFNKTEKEKLDILNSTFEFAPQFLSLSPVFNEIDNAGLLSMIITRLMKIGYHEISITLLNNSISRTKDPFALYSLYENLATMKRELGFYDKAKEDYEKCLSNLKRSKPRVRYKEAVELKNIGEMCLRLGKEKEANSYFSRIDHHVPHLNDFQRFGVLWNLANAYRRVGEYEKEYQYLNKSLEHAQDVPNENFHIVMDRIERLRIAIDMNSGKMNKDLIHKAEKNDEFMKCFEYGQHHYMSFQIDGSIEWFKRANEMVEDPDALSWIGHCHMLQNRNDDARSSLERSYDLNPEDYFVIMKLGIIDIRQNDHQSGVGKLQSAHNQCLDQDGDKYHFYQELLKSLVKAIPRDEMKSIIDHLSDQLPEKYESSLFYVDLGTEMSDLGFLQEGLDYYNIALERATTDKRKASVQLNIGSVHANFNDHRTAIDHYEKALKLAPEFSVAWNNMASSYGYLLNYEKALSCQEKAFEHCPPKYKAAYEYQYAFFKGISEDVININFIPDEEIKTVIRTAERIIQITDENGKIEFSGPIRDYGKSIEMMLNRAIALPFAKNIQKDSSLCSKRGNKYFIKQYLFTGTKSIKRLDSPLANLIRDSKGLSLGAWLHSLKDVNVSSSNPIEERFKKVLNEQLSRTEITELMQSVGSIYGLRNGLSHHSIISREKALGFRKLFIPKLNNTINILYAE